MKQKVTNFEEPIEPAGFSDVDITSGPSVALLNTSHSKGAFMKDQSLEFVTFPNFRKVIAAVLVCGLSALASASGDKTFEEPYQNDYSEAAILKNSQVSYSADGGFSGVRSFSVIISCVNGRISTLKSIHNPKINEQSPVREKGSMDVQTYLSLWKQLEKQDVMAMKDAPQPRVDISDEFTVSFETRIGKRSNTFMVYGITRPETCRYYAIKSAVDHVAAMRNFWETHQQLARN